MKSLVLGLVAAALAAFSAVCANGQEITGAGSTFAYPVISEWSRAYERAKVESDYRAGNAGLDSPPAGAALDYEPVGSLAGTMRVQNGDVDFAASDVPLKSEELAKLGLGQFPIVIGGVVAAVNLDGIGPGEIRFTGQLLADIFLGTVQKWSDPAIQAFNPDIELPDAKIAVVHRSDGSGTTFNFADYLSKVSPAWKEKMGADTLLRWPTGIGAKGNSGVALAIKQTKNSIGYVEFAQATQAQLSYALIQNRAGKFVKPEPASFQSAAATADWTKASDFHLLLTDAPGDDAYPIAATVSCSCASRAPGSNSRKPFSTSSNGRWNGEQGMRLDWAMFRFPMCSSNKSKAIGQRLSRQGLEARRHGDCNPRRACSSTPPSATGIRQSALVAPMPARNVCQCFRRVL